VIGQNLESSLFKSRLLAAHYQKYAWNLIKLRMVLNSVSTSAEESQTSGIKMKETV
jgi:hypothetical protein